MAAMIVRAALLALLVLLAAPTAAAASTTVSSDGSRITIAGDGEADQVEVEYTTVGAGPAATDGLLVSNPAGVVPTPPCVAQGAGAARCPGDAATATLGGGDDTFTPDFDLFGVVVDVAGQAGNDTLASTEAGTYDGGDGDDTLRPSGYGDERFVGGPGFDTASFGFDGYATLGPDGSSSFGTRIDPDVERLAGGSGDDVFFIGPNAGTGHTITGAGGDDFVSYFGAAGPVAVTLDGAANDGTGARTDNIAPDVEGVSGSSGDDLLVGTDGENVLRGNGGRDTLVGDPGEGGAADDLSGGDGDDVVEGRGGNDQVFGSTGNDRLLGGAGDDTLAGGNGGDVLGGGTGTDSVSYDGSSSGVTVTMGGGADDGTTGEGDDVGGDVEKLFGSDGNDTLTGTDGDQELRGGFGDDRLDGRGGRDAVSGGSGNDTVLGGAGADDLRGGPGDDNLDGGPGEDLLLGQDRDEGTQSNDLLEMRDGERDSAACPAGITRVLADPIDFVSPSCVLVDRVTPAPGATTAPSAAPTAVPAPPLRIVRQRVRVDRRGYARIKASCPPGPACSGVLQLVATYRKRQQAVARTVFALPAGRRRTIRIRLTPLGRRLLRSRKVLRVQLAIAADAPNAAVARGVALRLRR